MCVWWKVRAVAVCVFVRKICVTQAPPACWSPSTWMWKCVSRAYSPSFCWIPSSGYFGKPPTDSDCESRAKIQKRTKKKSFEQTENHDKRQKPLDIFFRFSTQKFLSLCSLQVVCGDWNFLSSDLQPWKTRKSFSHLTKPSLKRREFMLRPAIILIMFHVPKKNRWLPFEWV